MGGWVFPDRFRALRPVRLPHLQAQVEDGQGDRWQEDGGSSLPEVERDGSVQLPAAAVAGLRHVQELRGPLPRRVHGRQRGGDAWQGHLVREEGGGRRWRQEEVIAFRLPRTWDAPHAPRARRSAPRTPLSALPGSVGWGQVELSPGVQQHFARACVHISYGRIRAVVIPSSLRVCYLSK